MAHTITANNVNEALSDALWWIKDNGIKEASRNGAVLVAPQPVLTTYLRPRDRVLFIPLRNANPFFHLMESLWMLAGRDDLEFPMFFNKRFGEYSDNGVTIHGAYGYRWRKMFDMDQLQLLIQILRKDPDSRRAVLQMWSAEDDLGVNSRDLPCNTHAYFDLRGGMLNMTVCCRSNDLWWGAYGANVVHFSMLQEYLASWLNVSMGVYRQFSNNFHLYIDILSRDSIIDCANEAIGHNYYEFHDMDIRSAPIRSDGGPMELWDRDLSCFLSDPAGDTNYAHEFFNGVVAPMFAAWNDRKSGRGTGLLSAEAITAPDWRIACFEWIKRAELKKAQIND